MDDIERLRTAIQNGAIGFGEIKSQVTAAGPEMQRLYALAAELSVPITIHFQEFSQPGSQGTFNTGLKQFDAMLKKYPRKIVWENGTRAVRLANSIDNRL